ncbi:MAG: hypothetical protein KBS42_00380 [Bacteroidales bacterium]|nr:hypothetical protein [Candidatus Colicola coprequi]
MVTKDLYKNLEPAHFLKDHELIQPSTPEDLETRRRLADFSREIDIATFMLAMSFKQPNEDPYLDLFEEKDFGNKFKHDYYRQYYLYSSLLWYQNAFEMLSQCLWFYHHLYKGDLKDGEFEKKILCFKIHDTILKRVFNGDESNIYTQFKNKHSIVIEWANNLKHRQFLENDTYLQYLEMWDVEEEKYHSDETKKHIHLEDLQSKLIAYHKDIIDLAKNLLIPIREDLNSRLGVYE